MNLLSRFYSGTSNVVSPLKQSEFPAAFAGASRLTYYASLFTSVEVNATFYKLPREATITKWSESVPEDFRFTFKLPKQVTHAKDFKFSFEELERFAETIAFVGEKKGCLLVQLPLKVSREKEESLAAILESLREGATGWKIAVEARHPSWYDSAVYRMLQGYGAGMVEHEKPPAVKLKQPVSDKFAYLRFHGPEGDYRGGYEEKELQQYATRIVQWLKEGKEVYAYFNNTAGSALADLQALNVMVGSLL